MGCRGNKVSDEELARQAQGDVEAFAALYQSYFLRVYRYFFFRTSNRQQAEDLTAIAFERILAGLKEYDPRRGPFVAWLFAIVRHLWIDTCRHLRQEQTVSLDQVSGSIAPTPNQLLLQGEQRRALVRYLAELSPREQEMLALKFGSSLTNRAIAEVMGLTESNVGIILYRAIGKLRDRFKNQKG